MLQSLRANLAATIFGLLAALFAIIAVVQSVKLDGLFWIKGANDRLEDCARDRNELRAIATAKNEQGKATSGNVKEAEKNEREAKPIADKIRAAPIPSNCATPGLDLLRNEI